MTLKEVEGFFQFLHGSIKGRGQEENAECPGVTRVIGLNAYTIFAGLISLNAATVVILDSRRAGMGLLFHMSLRSWPWVTIVSWFPASAGSRPGRADRSASGLRPESGSSKPYSPSEVRGERQVEAAII